MVDYVALASVVSSAAVAGGTLLANALSARGQRAHEATQAFEERAWDKKNQAMFDLVVACRDLADSCDDRTLSLGAKAVAVSRAILAFGEVVPGVEVYASPECRSEFGELRRMLERSSIEPILAIAVDELREEKVSAIDRLDFETAARHKNREAGYMAQAEKDFDLDLVSLKARAEALIVHARASLRGSP